MNVPHAEGEPTLLLDMWRAGIGREWWRGPAGQLWCNVYGVAAEVSATTAHLFPKEGEEMTNPRAIQTLLTHLNRERAAGRFAFYEMEHQREYRYCDGDFVPITHANWFLFRKPVAYVLITRGERQ